MGIRVDTLGGVRITCHGLEHVSLPRQRLRCALLVLLAVERQLSREKLLQVLWPNVDRSNSKRRLSQMLYELRVDLGAEWMEARREKLLGTASLRTDVQVFESYVAADQLVEASRLYHGPFLGSYRLAESREFDRWAESQRSRLSRLFRDMQGRLVRQLTQTGDLDAASKAAWQWATIEPLDDDAQYALMDLLGRGGARDEALRHYARYLEHLTLIDAEPATPVRELADALRSGGEAPISHPAGQASQRAASAPGIVVFPIQNLSADDDFHYFAQGLAEEIIHVLGRVSSLRVVPRSTAFTFDHPGVRVREAGLELGVSHALEGSVRFSGDRYRVQVALLETDTEREIWHDRFEGRVTSRDIFDVQDQIADAVLSALDDRLSLQVGQSLISRDATGDAVARARATADPEAHDLYLRARYAWYGRAIPQLDESLALFEKAVAQDPTYARAYAGIADVHLVLAGMEYAVRPPTETYGRAQAAATAALGLNPDLPQAHAALANYLANHQWAWREADERFRHAIALDAEYSPARQWYSNYLMCIGRKKEALAEAELAREVDPRSAFLASSLARHYQLLREPERAIAEYQRALALDGSLAGAHMGLAVARMQAGDLESCCSDLRRLGSVHPDLPILQGLLAYAVGLTGDTQTSVRHIQELKATRAPYLPPEYVCLGYIGIGETERALSWLEKAFEHRSPAMALLAVEPLFDPLRAEPRFQKLLVDVGLVPLPEVPGPRA